MRAIDVRHKGREKVICCWEVDGVLIDPGPGITEETLLAELGDFEPRRSCSPTSTSTTRARPARWSGAGRAAGLRARARRAAHVDPRSCSRPRAPLRRRQGLTALWGEFVPVPEANCARCSAAARRVEGFERRVHARARVPPRQLLPRLGASAFVGDVGGARIPPHAFTVAPTPPPDIDVAAWRESVEKIRAWAPSALGMTHFGEAPPITARRRARGP